MMAAMRDPDIRRVLRKYLRTLLVDDPAALLVEELGICCGAVRVDIAVVTAALKGFEIKSDQDTLKRLSSQAAMYNKVFDTLTIVTGERHLKRIVNMVPRWWGILVFDDRSGEQSSLRCFRSRR